MKRTRESKKTADAILISDLHLSENTPISRTDNYLRAQENKLAFLTKLQKQHNCSILCAGDVFDYWKASPGFCNWVYKHLPNIITVPGNHDLPMHSMEQYDKSALALLEAVGRIKVLKDESMTLLNGIKIIGMPYGLLHPIKQPLDRDSRRILILHELVWATRKPAWAHKDYTAAELIDEYGKDFDLILTGDNHQGFTVHQDNTILVNPGSMMRMSADQEEFIPGCYLYYAESNTVELVPYPIDQNVHNTEHLDRIKEKDERISSYIEKIKEWEGGLSFRKNLESFFKTNKVPKKVRDIIWEHTETQN